MRDANYKTRDVIVVVVVVLVLVVVVSPMFHAPRA
jgi:hypothetical protein